MPGAERPAEHIESVLVLRKDIMLSSAQSSFLKNKQTDRQTTLQRAEGPWLCYLLESLYQHNMH